MHLTATRAVARIVFTGLAIAFAIFAPSWASAATLHTYRAGIDVGNNPATGCDFSLGSIPPTTLPGFELQVTVVVDQALSPPQVVSAQVETCSGGVFANPQPLAGFVLELDNGLLGSDSVIGSIPNAFLGTAPLLRLAFHALSADGAQDALFTTNGAAEGLPIVVVREIPAGVPMMSGVGVALLVLTLLAVGWWRGVSVPRGAMFAMWLLTAGAAAVVYAAFSEPIAIDNPSDSVPPDTRAEIIAAFAMSSDSGLMLRLDIENIPLETICDDGIDNDGDGLVDCNDADCAQRPCNDGFGCTLDDQCRPAEGSLVCLGTPVDCSRIVGNECTIDTCVSTSSAPGNTNFNCESQLDLSKADFGSCTPDENCSQRNANGSCTEPIDACVVGRCVEPFACEAGNQAQVPTEAGGCDDGNTCTADLCTDGVCFNSELDDVPCSDGNVCTTGDTCTSGVCSGGAAEGPCDDGNACTDETCVDGACVGTPDNANTCSDQNPCTSDACSNGVCISSPVADQTVCDDGIACTPSSLCVGSTCQPESLDDGLCSDQNPCTDASCTPTGCDVALISGEAPCTVVNGECLIGTINCSLGQAVGDCVPNSPPEPCQ